jgi:hypothetical protein
VFKGLRETLREGPDGGRSKNTAAGGCGEEMASTARGQNGDGDQTLTLIFDSSEE